MSEAGDRAVVLREEETLRFRDGHASGVAVCDGRQKVRRLPNTAAEIAMAVEKDIVPRLVRSARRNGAEGVTGEEVALLVRHVLADRAEEARALLRDAHDRGVPIEAIQTALLAPAARRMGELWEDDACDFTSVWLGVRELQGFLRDYRMQIPIDPSEAPAAGRILLAAAPGEHHIFGIEMAAEFFTAAGWQVTCRPSASHAELVRIATRDWFDVVGLSIGAEKNLRSLADAVRAVRRVSFNPGLGVMVGGPAAGFVDDLKDSVGADWVAIDAREAVAEAAKRIAR